MTALFPTLHIISPSKSHHYTIILLHGRESNGPEFAKEFFESRSSAGKTVPEHFQSCKWIFPSSQKRYSTVFQEELNEWFDIYSLTDPSAKEELQVDGLSQSVKQILHIIDDEMRYMPTDRIILGGISQGFATSIHALLAGQHRLGGFIGISGWLPLQRQLSTLNEHGGQGKGKADFATFYEKTLGISKQDVTPTAAATSATITPGLLQHASDDDLVDIELGKGAAEVLKSLGMDLVFKTYQDCGHWIKEPEGVDDLVRFLEAVMQGGVQPAWK